MSKETLLDEPFSTPPCDKIKEGQKCVYLKDTGSPETGVAVGVHIHYTTEDHQQMIEDLPAALSDALLVWMDQT